MDQHDQRSRVPFIEPQPCSRFFSQPLADFTMILFMALAQIMQEQREMEQILPLDFSIHFSEHAGMFGQRFGLRHRQQTVLIDGVLVVLIELHESAHP